jgi:hypothetical protein
MSPSERLRRRMFVYFKAKKLEGISTSGGSSNWRVLASITWINWNNQWLTDLQRRVVK